MYYFVSNFLKFHHKNLGNFLGEAFGNDHESATELRSDCRSKMALGRYCESATVAYSKTIETSSKSN